MPPHPCPEEAQSLSFGHTYKTMRKMSVTLGRLWLYLFDFLVIISLSPHLQKYIKMACHLKSPGEWERVSVFQCSFLTSLPWNQKSSP